MDGGRRICLHLAKVGFDLDVNSKWIFISDASQGPVSVRQDTEMGKKGKKTIETQKQLGFIDCCNYFLPT